MLSIEAHDVLAEVGGAGQRAQARAEKLRAIVTLPGQISNLGNTEVAGCAGPCAPRGRPWGAAPRPRKNGASPWRRVPFAVIVYAVRSVSAAAWRQRETPP